MIAYIYWCNLLAYCNLYNVYVHDNYLLRSTRRVYVQTLPFAQAGVFCSVLTQRPPRCTCSFPAYTNTEGSLAQEKGYAEGWRLSSLRDAISDKPATEVSAMRQNEGRRVTENVNGSFCGIHWGVFFRTPHGWCRSWFLFFSSYDWTNVKNMAKLLQVSFVHLLILFDYDKGFYTHTGFYSPWSSKGDFQKGFSELMMHVH